MIRSKTYLALLFVAFALALVGVQRADAYDLIVVGDTNLFPFDTANAGDIGNMVDCYNGLAVCPPGCNQNLFPFDTCNAGDIGFMVDYLTGGALAFFPGSGYVNFTSDPGNPAGDNGTYGVIVDMVETGANQSGFVNVNGTLAIRAEIFADTGGGASITPSTALAASGNGLVVGTGLKAQGTSSVDLTCGAAGNVTIRYFVPAYAGTVGSGEHCAGGAACAPGEHFDQHDIVVPCGPPVDCNIDPDGTVCGRTPTTCDGGETCLGGACVDNGFTAGGTSCNGAPSGGCDLQDTCDGAGACTVNVETAGTVCLAAGADPTCDPADTCDGSSPACAANVASAGTACGDQGVECLVDDTCDGAGACTDNGAVADSTPCTDDTFFCTGTETCQGGACTGSGDPCGVGETCNEGTDTCDVGGFVIDLQEQGSGGTVDVDLVIDTSTAVTGGDNLGGYDVTITYDSTLASFTCPTGMTQPSPAFNEPLLNQCVVDTSVPTASTIRIADVNASKTATAGAVIVKTLQFTGVSGAQAISVALTGGDPNNLIDYDAVTVDCGGACTTDGASLAP